MIDTFNNLDYHHERQNSPTREAVAANDDAKSVRSTRSHQSTKSGAVRVSCSPGRYSLSRFIEDQMSARTIFPGHLFHAPNDFDEQYQPARHSRSRSAFGSLRAAPKLSETLPTTVQH